MEKTGFAACRIALIALLALATGCQRCIAPQNYFEYFEKNHDRYTAAITRNGMTAEISYHPNELYAARDMVSDTALKADKAIDQYKNSIFFLLTVKKLGALNPLEAAVQNAGENEKIQRLSSDNQKDIFLIAQNDTVPVASVRAERSLGIDNPDAFLLAFSRQNLKEKPWKYSLIIRNVSPELGTLEIRLSKIINKTPKLRGFNGNS